MTELAVSRPQRISLTRQCLRSIREYVVAQRLEPGDRLPSQQEWARLLGVSVLVVREALQALQALGLVEVQHGRGVFVRRPEDASFLDFLALGHGSDGFSQREVIEARAMLDLTALEICIARATPQVIAELEDLLQRLRENTPRVGTDSPMHRLFHQTILRASGNRLLISVGIPLLNTFWALGNTGQLELSPEAIETDMVDIHAVYLDAIKRRDLSRTRELVNRHLFGLCSYYRVFPLAGEAIGSIPPSPANGQS